MKKYIKYIVLLGVSVALLSSCGVVTKKYERPQNIVDNALFRTDMLPKDSCSLSSENFSWKNVFTDPLLQQYIQKGLDNNLDIRIALENLKISAAYAKQAKAGFLPSLNLTPSVTYTSPSLNGPNGTMLKERTNVEIYDFSATTIWELDIWGKIAANTRANKAQYLTTVAAHKAVTSEIVAAVAATYYQLLALDEQKRVTEATIGLQKKNLESTKALKEAGSLTAVGVEQTQAQLINMQTSLLAIENTIQMTENQLCFLLGKPSNTLERSTFESQKLPDNLEAGYPSELLQNRPDVMAAELQFVQAFEVTNMARASLYPSLRLSASAGLQSLQTNNFFDINSFFANIVGGLTQPIFNQRKLKTQLEVSQANQEKALLNFKKTLLLAGQEVSNALRDFDTQNRIIALKQKEADSYSKASAYSEELLNYGMANYLEVLRSQENALRAQLSIVNAKLTRMTAIIRLYKALGGGWR